MYNYGQQYKTVISCCNMCIVKAI